MARTMRSRMVGALVAGVIGGLAGPALASAQAPPPAPADPAALATGDPAAAPAAAPTTQPEPQPTVPAPDPAPAAPAPGPAPQPVPAVEPAPPVPPPTSAPEPETAPPVTVPPVAPAPAPRAAPAPQAAPPDDPPGNNGTIKVDGVEFDDHPNNQPHPGCVFQVDFYGFDQGDLQATVEFEAIPPSDGGVLLTDTVFIGQDPAGGGTDLDAARTYDLSAALAGIDPHDQQGWHVDLNIDAEGSQGSGVKQKTFWVSGCVPTPTTTTPPTTSPPTTTPPTTTTPTTCPPTTTPPTTSPPTTTPPTTSPPTTTPPTTTPPTSPPSTTPPRTSLTVPLLGAPGGLPPSPGVQGPRAVSGGAAPVTTESSLPQTGTDVGGLVVTAVVLLSVGAATFAASRRRQPG